MNSTNFHQLYIFFKVARLQSFSKAAQELSISQPAVSIQVRELENSLGTSLLHRMRRELRLTETGEAVFSYTQRIFALAEEMHSVVQDIQGLHSGKLTIGSSTTPGEYILPWLIGKFRREHAGIQVSMTIANTQSVIDQIYAHELDLGMAGSPVNIKGLASFPYVQDNIVVISAPNHPLAQQEKISIRELRKHDFIMREPGSATRKTAEVLLNARNIEPQVTMELGSNEAIKRAVAAGLGLGVLSEFSVTPDVAAGMIKVLQVSRWECHRQLSVFYRDDKYLSAAQSAFLEFLRNDQSRFDLNAEILGV
jgi:DNA-binding transcriptional LysR family regulator